QAGVNILGTDLESITLAEDRKQFNRLLTSSDIPTPAGFTAYTMEEALEFTKKVGYPALVRPSFVLGGRGMEIVTEEKELLEYLRQAVKISPEYPVLIDDYIKGTEVEVDAIADGEQVLIPGIMEHVERAGVHSGDSMAVYPAHNIERETRNRLLDYTKSIVRDMNIRGLVNIQYVVDEAGKIYVLEVNPRSSRTIPILSKVTGVPMVKLAVEVMLGNDLSDMTDQLGLLPPSGITSVKVPVFSFDKLTGVDINLTPEMKSTGEVLGTSASYTGAITKGLVGSGFELPAGSVILFSLADRDKSEGVELAADFEELGYKLLATENTAKYFRDKGLEVEKVENVFERLQEIDLLINTPTRGKDPDRKGFQLRRQAVEYNIPSYTSLDTVEAILKILKSSGLEGKPEVFSLQDMGKGVYDASRTHFRERQV
ncbi:MAG: ATP-grasp domain-containing protein, partial [Bacillota bacterium]